MDVVVKQDGLAKVLAERVANELTAVLAEQEEAVLAVSGGRTPVRFFQALSKVALDWSRVVVTLVDDRAVPWDSPRSNTILVRENLLVGEAAVARFVPLTEADGTVRLSVDLPGPVDVAHFGMGTDGHTASWFPEGDGLDVALADEGPDLVSLSAPGAPEPRVTFTWAALKRVRLAVLHFEGAAKAATFGRAVADGPIEALPVRRLLRQDSVPVVVHTDHPILEITR